VQTVDERHGLFRRLMEAFHRRTGCPVTVNTSFNLGWEPIVNTPQEAYTTFMSSGIDVLCMGRFLLCKSEQRSWLSAKGPQRPQELLGDLLASPCCGAAMKSEASGFACAQCRRGFPVEDGICHLYWPHEAVGDGEDVTEAVKAFYEETPFPNYQDHESVRSLIDKSRRGGYGHALHQTIPFNSDVLEVGCGTGQLANFLGVSCRRVVGSDLCLNSLKLGEEFRREHGLEGVGFAQMNLFRPVFRPESFDVVLCNGVLHHTSDPFGGFRRLVPLVRPGGHIVVGLYNRWGRLMTDLRRLVFRTTGGRGRWLDPYLRSSRLSRDKQRAWFADQYQHPHESKHTMGEILDWFEQTGVRFVRGVPSTTLGGGTEDGTLFSPEACGNAFDHFLVQCEQIWRGSKEGGFFLMIGRVDGERGAGPD
jgi:SAM-dependent methyltransferase